jgi:hypothetical protein
MIRFRIHIQRRSNVQSSSRTPEEADARAEIEIDGIENKIANADDSNTYPADYAAMRSEQETQRQRALKCKAEIDEIPASDKA